MKKLIAAFLVLSALLLYGNARAQYVLLDDMEGNGPLSGNWFYYKGASSATGNVEFHVSNPSKTGLNTSNYVAKFTKDTTCTEYMLAGCYMDTTVDLRNNSTFKIKVYSSLTEEVLFKLQTGNDYANAVFFKYKIKSANQWEEATYNFSSVKNRTNFDRLEVHFMDGKKANGILYFDYVEGPDPIIITTPDQQITMGQENGAVIPVSLKGSSFKPVLTPSNWTVQGLPAGVSLSAVQRSNDSTVNLVLSGNSPVIYSRTDLKINISSQELTYSNAAAYKPAGRVTLLGNPDWTLVFSDEFESSGIPDQTKWKVDPKPKGWINGEKQVYTDTSYDNARIRNGDLVIVGKKDYPNITTTDPWSSGRVITQNKFDFKYGRVDVRAKLPKARGSWPAIWLLPTTTVYGAWPASGEIDIMEHVGNSFGKVLSTVHTQNNNWTNNGHLSATKTMNDVDTVYHVYSMEWSEDSLRFTYDSNHCYTYVNPKTDWKDWPFDQKFYLILNVAIGGGMGGSITDADWPDSMSIDYVHIYQKGLGTPVLDSMSITPLNRAVVSGASQPYSAKIFDQNSYAMNLTPTWSITGAGNTISPTGMATVVSPGVVTATAVHDTVTLSVSTNVSIRAADYKAVPARIEAEDNDYTNICCTEPASDTSGVVCVNYISSSSWLEYDIDVPATGNYVFQFRVAVNTASTIRLVRDNTILTTVSFPASGGWQKWITVTSKPVSLPAGRQTIRIEAATSGWNFNWLKIVGENEVAISSIDVGPDSSSVFVGGRAQFNSKIYGTDSSRFDIKPTWSAGGAGVINANGLLVADSIPGLYTISATAGGVTGTAKLLVQGPPHLARMELVPDTVVIPHGGSQLFTIKGFDQYDSTFVVTGATWSVTGAGNAITSAGALTVGSNGGVVTATKDTVSGSAVFTVDYVCTFNKRYEAESASSKGSGPVLETTTDTSGVQNFTNIVTGNWFAYNKLAIPVSGKYNIRFRVLTTAAAKIRLENNGKTYGIINIPNTGGAWATISDTISFPAMNYFNVRAHQGTFKFNWFSIDNCAVDTSSSMLLTSKGIMTPSFAGIEKEADAIPGGVQLYPNPVKNTFTITIAAGKYHSVSLIDLNGKQIRQWSVNSNDSRITRDVSFLSPGVYILKLDGKPDTKTIKVIKQ